MSDTALLAEKVFHAVAEELEVDLQNDQVKDLIAGKVEAASPSALQIAQAVCAVVEFLHADVCPLVPKK